MGCCASHLCTSFLQDCTPPGTPASLLCTSHSGDTRGFALCGRGAGLRKSLALCYAAPPLFHGGTRKPSARICFHPHAGGRLERQHRTRAPLRLLHCTLFAHSCMPRTLCAPYATPAAHCARHAHSAHIMGRRTACTSFARSSYLLPHSSEPHGFSSHYSRRGTRTALSALFLALFPLRGVTDAQTQAHSAPALLSSAHLAHSRRRTRLRASLTPPVHG